MFRWFRTFKVRFGRKVEENLLYFTGFSGNKTTAVFGACSCQDKSRVRGITKKQPFHSSALFQSFTTRMRTCTFREFETSKGALSIFVCRLRPFFYQKPDFRFFGFGGAITWRTAANSVLMLVSFAVTARSNSSNLVMTFFCSSTVTKTRPVPNVPIVQPLRSGQVVT